MKNKENAVLHTLRDGKIRIKKRIPIIKKWRKLNLGKNEP